MRAWMLTSALFAAACGAPDPADAPEDASAGSTGVGDVPGPAFEVEQEALVGVWSFDRTCASGDGMRLNADGTASFDEWGQGAWTFDAEDRVVLTLERFEPGVGPTGETVVYTLAIGAPVTDDLVGHLSGGDIENVRGVNALRCPE